MSAKTDRLLDVREAAERMGLKGERFPRRLVAERRIEYVKVGSHVRIRESAIDAYLAANTVEPIRRRPRSRALRRAA
ncbi:excisionase family DNA-binding protein [Yinghuangia soli]|uniref:Excisionase family DNA-binding protein n=1 Tax=Yinghuangia soli TaxID=2908204 RepID=A0AA41PWS0_9ACTN|nr:excisionase family DNA-binding protein [Yinghuangia soli]MCF2526611.1 excisionase family DNA-binding protein [Yinghuangia soli]